MAEIGVITKIILSRSLIQTNSLSPNKYACGTWVTIGGLCCDGLTCYNPYTKRCCGDGTGCDETNCEICKIIEAGIDCATTCTVGGPGGICGEPSEIRYSNVIEKICDPEGCPGDCNHDTHWCWKKYQCVGTEDYMSFATCSNIKMVGGYPITLPYYECFNTVPFPGRCYSCAAADEPSDTHYVDNDSCN